MKVSTVELLVDEKVIKLIECIKVEILVKCLKYISTIKSILVALITYYLFSIVKLTMSSCM